MLCFPGDVREQTLASMPLPLAYFFFQYCTCMYIYLTPPAGITQTLTLYPVILDSYPSNKVCVCVDIHRTLFLDNFRPVRKTVKNAYDTYKM